MAFSSYNSKLMYKPSGASATWTQLCSIKGLPQIGGEPEQIETTTLDDSVVTNIDGIQSQDAMSFVNNYEPDTYDTIKALEGTEQELSIWLGNDGQGSKGKFTGKGKITVYLNEADTNSVVEMTIVVTVTSKFVKEATV